MWCRYITRDNLSRLNDVAIEAGFNRTLTEQFFKEVPEEQVHPVTFNVTTSHFGVDCVRAGFLYRPRDVEDPLHAQLDIPIDEFMALPSIDVSRSLGVSI